MTKKEKHEIIANIKREGKERDLDYVEVIRSIDKMSGSLMQPVEDTGTQIPDDYFDKYYGMSPKSFMETIEKSSSDIKNETGIGVNYNLDSFLNTLNKSKLYPYTAGRVGSMEEGSQQWGFYKDIDRYEKAFDNKRNPIYLKYYKDGTYDNIDKEKFDNEKYYNYMPKEMKSAFKQHVDEGSMDDNQRSMMYNNITDHQSNVLLEKR